MRPYWRTRKQENTGIGLCHPEHNEATGVPMTQLLFRPDFIRFIIPTRSVHVIADWNGRPIDVVISRRVIEYLAETTGLDRDQSFTIIIRNKDCLQRAAARAVDRYGSNTRAVAVELADVKLAGMKLQPMIVGPETVAKNYLAREKTTF
jgi:hypothetical protein